MRDFDVDIKEELRRFLIYDLEISPKNIDKIDVCRMMDGQLRNINITFIPSINKEGHND